MQKLSPSERQLALFALAAQAISLARDGAIQPDDLTKIAGLLQALIEVEREEARDAA